MKEILKLENVIKMYGGERRAVNDVSLCVFEGENIMISGAAGSGKSTLMRLIAGMEHPSAGEIFILNKAVHTMDSGTASVFRNHTFGVMLRSPAFMEHLPVLENVALPLAIRGMAAPQRAKKAMALLKELGLSYAAHTYPGQLSIYEAQLASLARAIISKPGILLLDEITANLSEKESGRMLGMIHALWQAGDYSIISFSTAKDSVLRPDRCFRLDHGTIREEIE
ncbi:MAG: ABC transporter ATP-binding protein [Christensenellales bacterium]